MIIIYPELQNEVRADSEDSNYLAVNLLDPRPKKIWRAVDGVYEATLTVDILSDAEALGLFYTNAVSATVTITKNSDGSTVDTQTHTLSGTRIYKQFLQTFTQVSESCTATIELTGEAGATLEAGVIRVGKILQFKNPSLGMRKGHRDYSIITQLSTGAQHVRQKDIVREFGLSFILDRDTEGDDLMELFDDLGQNPFGALVLEGYGAMRYAAFGYLVGAPDAIHDRPSHDSVSLILREAI